MQIKLTPYPASAGPTAAKQLRHLRERSAAARARLERDLAKTLEAFEAAFERTDRQRTVRDRIADAAQAQSQGVRR